jgi:hypothetical protein
VPYNNGSCFSLQFAKRARTEVCARRDLGGHAPGIHRTARIAVALDQAKNHFTRVRKGGLPRGPAVGRSPGSEI